MTTFDDYATKYQTVRMERRDGILQMTFHTNGGPLQCDIVLAADDVQFQDSAHFPNGMVPGDGMHIIYPLLLGWNRGRYFLLTGQTLDAAKALELGLVSELLPRPELLPRAWALAQQIAQQPALLLRYTRVLFTQPLKKQLIDYLGYGLALEGMSVVDRTVTPGA